MIEDMIFKSFYMEKSLAKYKIDLMTVKGISKTKNVHNNESNRDNIFSNNVDNNIDIEKKEVKDPFMIIDTCEISEEGMRLYELSKKALENTPNIREEKVEKIKEQIKNGTYNITAEEFAEKLLKD